MREICVEPGCQRRASFNFEEKKAIYCAKHRKPGMILPRRARCAVSKCKISASFRKPGEKTMYCNTHKPEGALPAYHRTRHHQCSGDLSCTTNASFSFTKESPIRFCRKHAPPGVKRRYNGCSENSCSKPGTFSYPIDSTSKEAPQFCSEHKKSGMVIINSLRCKSADCPKFSIITVNGVRFCREHANQVKMPMLTFDY